MCIRKALLVTLLTVWANVNLFTYATVLFPFPLHDMPNHHKVYLNGNIRDVISADDVLAIYLLIHVAHLRK